MCHTTATGENAYAVKPQPIDPRLIGHIANNDTAYCICNSNYS